MHIAPHAAWHGGGADPAVSAAFDSLMALYACCSGPQWLQAGGWREAAERGEPPMFWTEQRQYLVAQASGGGGGRGGGAPPVLKGCRAVADEFSFGWHGFELDLEALDDDKRSDGGGGGDKQAGERGSRRRKAAADAAATRATKPRRRRRRRRLWPGLELDLSYNKLRGRLPGGVHGAEAGGGRGDDAGPADAAAGTASPLHPFDPGPAAVADFLDDPARGPADGPSYRAPPQSQSQLPQPQLPQPQLPQPQQRRLLAWPGGGHGLGGGLGSVLTKLHLAGNALAGPLPADLALCSRLTELCLGHNRLSGEVPRGLLRRMVRLRTLSLAANRLSGRAPHLAHLKSLEVLGNIDRGVLTVVACVLLRATAYFATILRDTMNFSSRARSRRRAFVAPPRRHSPSPRAAAQT